LTFSPAFTPASPETASKIDGGFSLTAKNLARAPANACARARIASSIAPRCTTRRSPDPYNSRPSLIANSFASAARSLSSTLFCSCNAAIRSGACVAGNLSALVIAASN
jgi:hypothetical protein